MTLKEWINEHGTVILPFPCEYPLGSKIEGVKDKKNNESIDQPFILIRKSSAGEYLKQMEQAGICDETIVGPVFYEVTTD